MTSDLNCNIDDYTLVQKATVPVFKKGKFSFNSLNKWHVKKTFFSPNLQFLTLFMKIQI